MFRCYGCKMHAFDGRKIKKKMWCNQCLRDRNEWTPATKVKPPPPAPEYQERKKKKRKGIVCWEVFFEEIDCDGPL